MPDLLSPLVVAPLIYGFIVGIPILVYDRDTPMVRRIVKSVICGIGMTAVCAVWLLLLISTNTHK